jgi:rfaE bifunctional protein kinase chain/domain
VTGPIATGPIVVVGDLLLDRDVTGTADRLCPDAPVPVLTEQSTSARPGGAGLAATFLARDGAEVVLVGAAGTDDSGLLVRDLLDRIGVTFVEVPYDGPTPEKIRLRSGSHPLLRLDRGVRLGTFGAVGDEVREALRSASAVLVSDYGRGITGLPAIRRQLAAVAPRVPLVWDPHPRGATPVPEARLVCPNRTEAAGFAASLGADLDDGRIAGITAATDRAVAAEARILRGTWRAAAVAVTMGHRGAMLAEGERPPTLVPAPVVASGDSCGAGDRFAAAAVLALTRRAGVAQAVRAAVATASAYVEAGGPAVLSRQDYVADGSTHQQLGVYIDAE